jgi:hypothetical protein
VSVLTYKGEVVVRFPKLRDVLIGIGVVVCIVLVVFGVFRWIQHVDQRNAEAYAADRAETIATLGNYGYPSQLLEVERFRANLSFGACPGVDLIVVENKVLVIPNFYNHTGVEMRYDEFQQRFAELGYGYCDAA